jgi:hypothetical protein
MLSSLNIGSVWSLYFLLEMILIVAICLVMRGCMWGEHDHQISMA